MKPCTKAALGASAVTPSIWWVGRGVWGGLPALTGTGDCNIWLLKGARFDVLIDAGCGAPGLLARRLREAGSAPERIHEIWVTHSHWDHLAGACAWAQKYPQARVRVPRLALQFINRGDFRLVGLGFRGRREPFVRPRNFTGFAPGAELACPPWRLKVVALPGHVPDLCGFRGTVDGLDAYFTGDGIIGDQGPVRGNVGWLDGYWLSSVKDYRATLRREVKRPPDLFMPGHGVPHAGASVRRSFRNCLWRVNRIAAIPHLGTMVPFA